MRVEPARHFLARVSCRGRYLGAGKHSGGLGLMPAAAIGLSSIHRFPGHRKLTRLALERLTQLICGLCSAAGEPVALQVRKVSVAIDFSGV